MKTKKLLAMFVLAVASFTTAAAQQQQMQMPPIPVDPDVRIGKLDNGLT